MGRRSAARAVPAPATRGRPGVRGVRHGHRRGELSLTAPFPASRSAATRTYPRNMGQRVLVVDDDPTVSDVVRRYLERAGLAVTLAADGPAALRAFEAERPDLVVLDLMLPGIDGLEVCRRLRARADDVPVVMLTALGDEEDRVLGLQLGADDYVSKPFSPRELVLRVQSVLRRSGPGTAVAAETLQAGGLDVHLARRV